MKVNKILDHVPEIRLTHGKVVWLLLRLGFHTGGAVDTFNEYLKSLRRFGIPFTPDELAARQGKTLTYTYDHLMELAVALTLRVYSVLPWALVSELIRNRDKLRSMYRRAYVEREGGLGSPIIVKVDGSHIKLRGIYLDLNFRYENDEMIGAIDPKIFGPKKAVRLFSSRTPSYGMRAPLALSSVASDVVHLAAAAPVVQRGVRELWQLQP